MPQQSWFAVWDGFGATRSDIRSAPTLQLPNRDYHLLVGPVEAATESTQEPGFGHQSPNLGGPRAAYGASPEIDLNTTYIGCSQPCQDEILARQDLEAFAIDPATGVDLFSDPLNRLPEP